MKKAYIVKLCGINFSNEGIRHGFEDNEYSVKECDWQLYKMRYGIKKLREYLIKEVEEYKPDIIFAQIQNSEVLDIDTWKELQKHGKVCNFTFDVREYEQTKWMYEVCPFISMTAFACREDVAQCRYVNSQFGINESGLGGAMVLQSSCDMEFYHKVEPVEWKYPEVIFIGNNYEKSNLNFPKAAERQRIIEAMYEEFGDRFGAYGLGQRNGYLSPEMEREVYSSAMITYTQNNYNRVGYCSDRVWRAMACGCTVIQEFYEEMPVNIMPIWNNFQDLKAHIKLYLNLNKIGSQVGEKMSHWVRKNHSYANRVKQIEGELKFIQSPFSTNFNGSQYKPVYNLEQKDFDILK